MPPGELAVISNVQTAITQLLHTREPQMLVWGWRLMTMIMVWRVFRLGVKWMYSRQDHSGELIDLLGLLGINTMFLTFYDSPIPGVGISASNLITDSTAYLANILDARTLQHTFESLDILGAKFVQPSYLDVLLNLWYWALSLGLIFTKAVALGVVATSLIFAAVVGLVGPLFVPFLSASKLDWVFWGWLKTFLTYSFLQVTMMAYLLVGEFFISRFVQGLPDVVIDSQYPLYIAEVGTVLLTFVVGVILVPILNHGLFTGHGGGTGAGIFANMVRR